jgi:heme/copper-type cytochrome/quinol oxidase subunit 1
MITKILLTSIVLCVVSAIYLFVSMDDGDKLKEKFWKVVFNISFVSTVICLIAKIWGMK